MRTVVIGTPCYDGKLDVWYTNSLIRTIALAATKGVNIVPIWVSFDALVQRARNDTLHVARMSVNADDLIWIDSDIEWDPEWIFKLLDYPVDIVGGTYPKKSGLEAYVVRMANPKPITELGLMEVDGLGTGFVRMSRRAMDTLWNESEAYTEPKDGQERRMAFNVVLENGQLISEDISAFNTLVRAGLKVYLDPNMTCNHVGSNVYKGDFLTWFNKLKSQGPKKMPSLGRQL